MLCQVPTTVVVVDDVQTMIIGLFIVKMFVWMPLNEFKYSIVTVV